MNNERQSAACRILLTVPNLDPTASPWREVMGLAKYLPRDRFRLTICALRPKGVEESTPLLQEMGVECFVARFRPKGFALRRLLGSVRDRKCLRDHGPFDLQHSMDFTSSPFEALMSRGHVRAFLFSQSNMNENGSRPGLKLKAWLSQKIICISDATLRLMGKLARPTKLVKIYPGIETDCISWRPPSREKGRPFRVLMVGHIQPRKRLEDGIGAVQQLIPVCPEIQLQVAGRIVEAGYFEKLQQLVRGNGLEDHVKFLGLRMDVPELMRQSDALLHAAESEAFGMVIIEAMAVGLPVIAPAIEGPKEIIEDQVSGLLVPPGEVGRYAEAIRALVKNPELSRQISATARKRVETCFTSRRMAQETAEVYARLLADL
jgi:glycosyltransferase involved in cell wall biosynthesis